MKPDIATIIGPVLEPITTQEAKDHLRVTFEGDDSEIAAMITAARQLVEARSGMRLFTQTIEVRGDNWLHLSDPNDPEILRLGVSPVQSITSVKYYDGTDVDTTMTSTLYWSDLLSVPARLQVKSTWPSTNERIGNIRVRCVAGYTSVALIPPLFKTAIKLLVGHYYENREQVTDLKLMEIPEGVNALIQTHPEFHHYATGAL